jgi:TP901 family phage tail tape measure protein
MPNQVIYSFIANDRYIRIARKISAVTRDVKRAMKDLGPAASRASRRVGAAFARMRKAVRGLMTSLGPLIAAFAGVAGAMKFVGLGSKFEDSLQELSAITGAAGADLDMLAESSKDLSVAWRTSAPDIAEGFKLVASAKPELLENLPALKQVTSEVLKLKNATGLDMATAARVTAVSLNQFGAGAEEAARFVNVLAAGSKFGSSEVADTGKAVLQSGVAATQAGLNFEELNGAIQTLAINGEMGRRAGTGLKTMIAKLDIALQKGGKGGIAGVGGMSKALKVLEKASLDTEQMVQLFGFEAFKIGGILAKNTALYDQQTAALTGTNVATEQADIRMNSLSSRAKEASAIFQTRMLVMFDMLKPALEGSVGGFKRLAESIDVETLARWAEKVQLAIRGVKVLAKVVGAAFVILGPIISLMLLPVRALIFALEKVFEVANAIKLLGGFASEAISDFFGNEVSVGGGKLESSSSAIAKLTVAAEPGSKITEFQSETTTTGAGTDVGISTEGPL